MSLFIKNDKLDFTAHLILSIGVVFCIGAVLTGNLAVQNVETLIENMKIKEVNESLKQHESYATFTLWLYTVILIVKTYIVLKKKTKYIFRFALVFLAVLGLYLIYKTGDFGGKVVHEYGVGTKMFNERKAE
ncbi:MAG: hypothetical protein JW995_02425 [Melioribacteraceae bacterium]|nr:hypothetical protein [Melioribacteraceae bacterium]